MLRREEVLLLSLRAHLWIFLGLLAGVILLGIAGNLLAAAGYQAMLLRFQVPLRVLFLSLVLALPFAFAPVMVKLVVGFQTRVANGGRPAIRALASHQTTIIWGLWVLLLAGIAVALPAAIKDGFLGGSQASTPSPDLGPSQGVLVAAPGMAVAGMLHQSSLKLAGGQSPGVPFAGGGVFELRIAGTGTAFKQCRYYFISTESKNPQRIEGLSIGTAPRKLTRSELDAVNAAMRRQLREEGWLPGHEAYKTEENQRLHGGATQGPDGWIWLKNGIVLRIETRRMDDPVQGEVAAVAGEWIQFIELWPRAAYPGIEFLEFQPTRN